MKQFLIGIANLLIGIPVFMLGMFMMDNQSIFDRDFEVIINYAIFGIGMLAVILGIFLIIIAIIGPNNKAILNVYQDHIEGQAFRVIGNTQSFVNFYEKFDKIVSASAVENKVVISMRDGSSLDCVAYNAQEVVTEIRKYI